MAFKIGKNIAPLNEIIANIQDRGVNVKYPPVPMVGAKGDNAIDDTQVFKNLLADSTMDLLIIPIGTYVISDTLVINRPVTIIGADKMSTTLKLVGGGKSLIHVAKTVNTQAVHLSNLNLTGTKTSDTGITIGSFNNNISPINAVDCSFKDIRISMFTTPINCEWSWCLEFENIRVISCTDSLVLSNQANNLLFKKCNFSSCTNGMKLINIQGVSYVECSFEGLNEVIHSSYYAFITMVAPYIENIATQSLGNLSSGSSLVIEGGYGGPTPFGINITGSDSKLFADNTTIKLLPAHSWKDGTDVKHLKFLTGIRDRGHLWAFGVPFPRVISNANIVLKKSSRDIYYSINPSSVIYNSNILTLSANTSYMIRYKGRAVTSGTQDCIQLYLNATTDGSGGNVALAEKRLHFETEFVEKAYIFSNTYSRTLSLNFLGNNPIDLKYLSIVELSDDYVVNESRIYANAIPTQGVWEVGDTLYNSVPGTSGVIGWVCITAGTPGTWEPFGIIGEAQTVLKSPDGSRFKLTIGDDGAITSTKL
jgi:hypothetical protein